MLEVEGLCFFEERNGLLLITYFRIGHHLLISRVRFRSFMMISVKLCLFRIM